MTNNVNYYHFTTYNKINPKNVSQSACMWALGDKSTRHHQVVLLTYTCSFPVSKSNNNGVPHVNPRLIDVAVCWLD